jgi:chaperone BCS1
MWDYIVEALQPQLKNEFFSGGALLVVLTATLAALRNVPRRLWALLQRRFVTTVDISDHDPAFFWVQKWLGDQPYTKTKARLLTASTRTGPVKGDIVSSPSVVEQSERKRQLTEIVFSPAPGAHLIRFKGHFILLTRIRREGENITGEVAYHESIEFRALSRKVIRDLIYEAREYAFPPEDDRIAIMKPNYHGWRISQRRPPRPFDSVILSGGQLAEIKDDLIWFFGAKEWYFDHGIPYQRGFLFHSPPGNGKTSVVVALASHFDRDIYIISLTAVTDNQLTNIMAELPEHSIVLIEDVDCVYQERKRVEGHEQLTFAGFLNSIDGVSAPTCRVLVMTTNHPELLDSALIRPGRIDRKFEFRNADGDMAQRLFERFFPQHKKLATEFGKIVASAPRELPMADLQEHLIAHRKDPEAAVTALRPSVPIVDLRQSV